MPSIKDIKKIKLNDEYIFFGPESIVSEIADSMDIKNIGAVPILNEQKILLGVVSERDIVRKCVKDGRDPDLVTASDIMTSEIITVDLKTSSEIAIKIMGENNIRHLPVVDDQNKFCLLYTSDAVTKSGSLPSLTHFLTMSLSETTPSNIFCSFSIGTAPIFLISILSAISLTLDSGPK